MVTTLFITTMITPHHNDLFVKTLFSTMILIPNQVKEAVILGHDGNVWAASQDFSVSSKTACCVIWKNIFHCFHSDKSESFHLVMQNNNR